MDITIPADTGIFRIAALEFAALWKKITDEDVEISECPGGEITLCLKETASEEYSIVSAPDGMHATITGGRPRALLYGVYRFFELRAGCRYFWDGDRVPKLARIRIDGLNLVERPRFEYRGLRYFAHRGLNRFQAEHWNLDEWKREIDWILKKRLNLFMLRIGLDDLFQKAFPEIVEYPDYEVPESIPRSYDDRNLFWSLQQRGELRRQILSYARERDLLHPEDFGTMTHWYSRTPCDFLRKVNPAFIPQATESYNEKTGLIWDIRDDRYLDCYFELTEAHIREYGAPDIFHTIGLAERNAFPDRGSNHRLKLYAYRRLIDRLRRKYPDAPLLIGSWDFSVYWTPHEVRELLRELDPKNTLIFDYTSDVLDEVNNFLNWGVVRKFPWIFGIFHTYAPASEIRGNYDVIERRLPVASADPMCRGLVFWPECSHSDTLMLEYMAANAWDPDRVRIDDFLKEFCSARYGAHCREMFKIWSLILPLVKCTGWPPPQSIRNIWAMHSDLIFRFMNQDFMTDLSPETLNTHARLADLLCEPVLRAPEIFRLIAAQVPFHSDEFLRRDLIDLARTAISRVQNYGFSTLALALEDWRHEKQSADNILKWLTANERIIHLEAELLAAHEDYSAYDSLQLLKRKYPTNPDFEKTLKGNIENSYCRSYIGELFSGIYIPEFAFYRNWIREKIRKNDRSEWRRPRKYFEDAEHEIQERFYRTPLRDFAPDHAVAFRDLPLTLNALAAITEQLIREPAEV